MKKAVVNSRGFALLEVVIAIAVFVIFAAGIYGGLQFVFKIVYQSRLRVVETGILNEELEIIRNLRFVDVGIINGSPSGVLTHIATTTRNGIDFTLTRTVRNIDDEFDGVIGGVPNDIAPADYKLVEVAVICDTCGQKQSLIATTFVSPKNLEGSLDHGALFINVLNAQGQPVGGADVHVVATSTDPAIDLWDTTDNEGMLRLVDLGEGIGAYQVSVSKDGDDFTTDQTIIPSEENPHPTKLPASVVAQEVTEIGFNIDLVSSLLLSTVNNLCVSESSVPVSLIGTKLSGTEPDIYKVNEIVNTDGGGLYSRLNLIWDIYSLDSDNYDLLGTIPQLPVAVLPGVDQPVQLILGPNTSHSLLVHVTDSITGQAVPNATAVLSAIGYSSSQLTGVGHKSQTDWSGGTGQLLAEDLTKYWSDDGRVEVMADPGNIQLSELWPGYVSGGQLESSVFDLGTEANYGSLIWEPLAQPEAVGTDAVRWQVATATSTIPEFWNYLGPDGTGSTYYDSTNNIISEIHDGDQYFRYKLFLSTASTTYTPTISSLALTYTNACTPPGQAYFGNLSNQEYSLIVTGVGYSEYA